MARIDDIPQSEDPRRTERAQARRQTEAAKQSAASPAAPADRVEVSNTAREAQALQDRLVDGVRNQPDVRQDKVAQARARMESGELDSPEARQAIADKLLESFDL